MTSSSATWSSTDGHLHFRAFAQGSHPGKNVARTEPCPLDPPAPCLRPDPLQLGICPFYFFKEIDIRLANDASQLHCLYHIFRLGKLSSLAQIVPFK